MIVYFDTSALVPLVIAEPATEVCSTLWDGADRVLATRLVYIEAAAALAQAHRRGRISEQEARDARSILNDLWSSFDVIELDGDLVALAATMATEHSLRGYDATHCAAAMIANAVDLVAGSGDARLLAAWGAEGIAVCDINP